jgi:hypothetical protein
MTVQLMVVFAQPTPDFPRAPIFERRALIAPQIISRTALLCFATPAIERSRVLAESPLRVCIFAALTMIQTLHLVTLRLHKESLASWTQRADVTWHTIEPHQVITT